jgi:monoamine oxidase
LPPSEQSYLGLLATVKAHYFDKASSKQKGRLGFWNYRETQRCAGGNQQLADRLARSLNPERRELRMRTPVRQLEVSSRGVRIALGADVTANGDTASPDEHFAYVILAAPPIVWPEIVPSPPFDKKNYTMMDGPAVKFLSNVSRRFWLDSQQAPKALWDKLGSVWEATDEGPKGPKQSAGKGAFCLTVFGGGSYVLPDIDSYARLLPDIYKKYPDYVVAKKLVQWHAKRDYPWIQTGYSIPAKGQVCTIAKNLSQPYQGRLFFAGEQSSPGFFGHMEGALDAGHRAAAQVALVITHKRGERGRLP